jgi:UDP-3-O-[3-hydroxymyristoyl] glucosamine N-acyltransferase
VQKRDNIVLGVNDLKQQQQRKVTIIENKNIKSGTTKSTAATVIVEKEKVAPITTIKVNNCEILTTRPKSVTATIFEHPKVLEKQKEDTKSRAQAVTKQIFRPLQQSSATSVTSKIFAPRTKDMNPGYLMFSEETDTGLTSE